MMKENKVSVIFSIVGILLGVVAFYVNNPALNFVIMLFVGYIVKYIVSRVMDIKEKFKWWSGSFLLYIFLWFVMWTILYNIRLIGAGL